MLFGQNEQRNEFYLESSLGLGQNVSALCAKDNPVMDVLLRNIGRQLDDVAKAQKPNTQVQGRSVTGFYFVI